MRIIDHFAESIRAGARFNPNVQAAPHCILWTDADRQWEVIIPRLQQEIPELFILGDYNPDQRCGPAIWLRCVLARTVSTINLPVDAIPILYLPGISRQDLRAVDTCPEFLKPLAELQYRGVIWSQVNAKDWTVLAYLQTEQGGLNLDVAQDKETKSAMQLALPNLMEVNPEQFRGKRLDRDDFYRLISGDPTGELLKWLDEGDSYRQKKSKNEWQAFVGLCRYQFSFNPETDGPISAAEKLANHTGVWSAMWERYCEAYTHYQLIPDRIRQANPPTNTIDWRDPTGETYDGWPQWNDYHEQELRNSLVQIADQVPAEARKTINNLEQRHRHRRQMVWANMGLSPLAQSLEYLGILATVVAHVPLDGGTIEDMASGYRTSGWQADDAVMRALSYVTKPDDQKAVIAAIRAIYLPWAEKSARYLQQLIETEGYPGGNYQTVPRTSYDAGTCILFVDGLRFDIARRLIERLEPYFGLQETVRWTALPSVTATGKPAVSPVRGLIIGRESTSDFEPEVVESAKSANHYHFEKLLTDSGWQILKNANTGDSTGRAWTEIGTIDVAGHNGNLAHKLDAILIDICDHIQRLLNAGWKQVEVVTDHGWLFLPDGLPKVSLPQNLTDNQWGRCAAIKSGINTQDRQFPWFWNPNQYFALADGISCFRNGISYAHGGLSLQECLTVSLTVTKGGYQKTPVSISIADIEWRELRCIVTIEGQIRDLLVDIRREPGNAQSSVAFSVKEVKSNGTASLVIENEDLRGTSVTVVVLTNDGQFVAQKSTTVGGDVNG